MYVCSPKCEQTNETHETRNDVAKFQSNGRLGALVFGAIVAGKLLASAAEEEAEAEEGAEGGANRRDGNASTC